MGQRLIIQNQINGESVNVSYYHWSAYTESSIEELKDFANRLAINYKNRSDSFLDMLTDAGRELIEKLDNSSLTDNEKIDLFNLMTYFSVSGTGASDKDSLKYLSQFTNDTNRQNVSRNEGLLAITEDDQDKTLNWSEGTLIVDWAFTNQGYPNFEQTVFDFSDLFFRLDEDEYNEYYNESEDNPISSLEKCPYPTRNVPLSQIEELQNNFDEHSHIWVGDNNEIFTFIE
jgi:hypothetical protein